MKFRIFFILVFSFLITPRLSAEHIVAGYYSYKFVQEIGVDSIEIEVEFYYYRDDDSRPGAPARAGMPDSLPTTIFNSSSKLIDVVFLQRISRNDIPDNISNPCVVDVPDLDYELGVFRGSIILAKNDGYTLVNQSCCRNRTIKNLDKPIEQTINGRRTDTLSNYYGNTFIIDIPNFNLMGKNSTPEFLQDPPLLICFNFAVEDIGLQLGAVDTLDNDSLAYSFCAPLDFNQSVVYRIPGFVNDPDTAMIPPYDTIPFNDTLSTTYQIPSSPRITIDPKTGALSGLVLEPFETYVVGICVEEYRNGQLISTTRRDFQLTTGSCDPIIISTVQDQEQFCDGLSVQFNNLSNSPQAGVEIQNYKWDFGVPGIDSDTSRDDEPFFTYPQEGPYTITLIANPDIPCSDTSTQIFEVFPTLEPTIEFDGLICKDDNKINFSVGGKFEPDAIFQWEFGNSANIQSSTLDSVPEIVFTGISNEFPIKLSVSQDNCTDSLTAVVRLFDNPTIDFEAINKASCYPLPVDFTNLSNTNGFSAEYQWLFGDGDTSIEENPTHIYMDNGFYDVSLELRTTDGCIDTLMLTKDSLIDVSLDSAINEINFVAEPATGCLPLSVNFIDSSTFDGTARYFWDFGDGNISTQINATNTYTDTGVYSVGLLVITEGKCVDTLVRTIDSAVQVLPVPISAVTASDTDKPLKEAIFTFDGGGSQFNNKSQYLINGELVDTNVVLNYQFKDTGRFQIQYVAFNEFNCADTSSVTVFVFDEFEFIIPNIFSPNGDGINDEFKVRACGVYDYEINIFNRYGEMIFASNSLNINWDGYVSGRPSNSGIFFYTIKIKDFKGEYLNYNGNIKLVAD